MYTTLYRSLVLLGSMFALTSSFSLSSYADDINPWVFEHAFDPPRNFNKSKFKQSEFKESEFKEWEFKKLEGRTYCSEKDDNGFMKKVKLHLNHLGSLEVKRLYYAFRVYKKKYKEQQIIGLVFEKGRKEGTLALYDKSFKPLEDEYAKTIKERTVDLTISFPFNPYYSGDDYMIPIPWKKPNQDVQEIRMLFDHGKINMKDNTAPKKTNLDKKDTNNTIWEALGFAGVIIVIIYIISLSSAPNF